MKQITIIGLTLILLSSCNLQTNDNLNSIEIITNDQGEVDDIRIHRSKTDSNYIQLTFYPDGEIKMLREFKNGEENGKSLGWNRKGNLGIEGYKINGEYDRVTREVYVDGRTAFEGKRIESEFEGINNIFYKSGAIERRWNRVKSKDFGRSIYYHENGLIKEIGDFTDTGYVLVGKWDENGEKIE